MHNPLNLRMPPIDPETLGAIYLAIGSAIYQLQTVESAFSTYLVGVMIATGRISRHDATKELDRLDGLTLGALVKEAGPLSLEKDLLDKLNRLRNERNWLIHGSCIDILRSPISTPAFEQTSIRIERLESLACDLYTLFDEMIRRQVIEEGEDPVEFKARAQNSIDRWASDEV